MSLIPESLQGRLVLLISLVALPGFLLLWHGASQQRSEAIQSAKNKAYLSLQTLSQHEQELVSRTERYLKRLASFSPTHYPNSIQCKALLRHALQLTDTYYNLGVPGADGNLECNALPLSKKINVSDRPYIKRALKTRQLSISSYQVDRAAGVASVNFAYPVVDPGNNDILGIAVAVVSVDWWSQRLAEIDLPKNAIAFITDRTGKIIAFHPKDQTLTGRTEEALNLNTESSEVFDQHVISLETDQSGVTRIFAREKATPGKMSPLAFTVGIPFGEELRRIEHQYVQEALILVVIYLLLLIFASWATRVSILNPIRAFRKNIEKIDRSDNPPEPLKSGIYELLQLHKLFVSNHDKRLAAERDLAVEKERFELAMQGANDGLFDWNLEDNSIYYSPRWKSMLGYQPHELANNFSTWQDLVNKEDSERSWDMLTDYINGRRDNFHLEFRMRHRDGHWVDILSRAFLVRNSEGKAVRVVGTHVDITESKRQELLLQQNAKVFEFTIEGVMITDPQLRIINVNRACEHITGYHADELIGQTPKLLQSGRHDKAFYSAMWATLKESGHWRGEIWNRRKDGTAYPEGVTISRVSNNEGEIINYIKVFSDISEIKLSEEKLQHLAHYDILTDLPNRLMFNYLLDQALSEARRNNSQLAVIFIDLDRFKTINDSMGHKAGDDLLKIVAGRLIATVRKQDHASRIGGDEFIILFKDIASISSLTSTIKQLMSVFEKPFELEGQSVQVTASLGISLFPDNGDTATTLIKNADAAMYRAKDEGRNTFQYYSSELTSMAYQRTLMENAIRQSLDQGDFYLLFQPQLIMESRQLAGIEALIQWNHPQWGQVAPARFIKVAEESGLIHEMGLWALETACAQASLWQQRNFSFAPLALDISSLQLTRKSFHHELRSIIESNAIDPSLIELEIAEGYFMLDIDQSMEQLESLCELGTGVVLDDFGSGCSSLSYLRKQPVKKLKIDQSFVGNITSDCNDLAIIDAIIAMGRALSMDVIATGVENRQQADILSQHGCKICQGSYFAKPMEASAIESRYLEATQPQKDEDTEGE